jgi:hypothetical protein
MFSNPITPDKEEKIRSSIHSVMHTFTQEFTEAIKIATVNKTEQSSGGSPRSESTIEGVVLPRPPPAKVPLKRGMVYKRGDGIMSWKKRIMVAWNASENYRLDYFDSDGKTMRGSISCAGYTVQLFDVEDVAQFGPQGFKLVPTQRMRRTWYVRCENAEEKNDWVKILLKTCYKTTPTTVSSGSKDALIASAFEIAFESLRHHFGYWDYQAPYDSHLERLVDFVKEIVARDCVDEMIANIADHMFKNGELASIETHVTTKVLEAVTAVWDACLSTAERITRDIENTVQTHVDALQELKMSVNSQLDSLLERDVNVLMADYTLRSVCPFLDTVTQPIMDTYLDIVLYIYNVYRDKIMSGDMALAERRRTFVHQLDSECDFWHHQPPVFSPNLPLPSPSPQFLSVIGTWKLYSRGGLTEPSMEAAGSGDKVEEFSHDALPIWVLRQLAYDHFIDFFHRATHAFKKLITEQSKVPAANHALVVCRRHVLDVRGMAKHTLLTLLKRLVLCPLLEQIIPKAVATVAPIRKELFATQQTGSPLPDLINLHYMTKETVNQKVEAKINDVVEKYLELENSKLMRLLKEIEETFENPKVVEASSMHHEKEKDSKGPPVTSKALLKKDSKMNMLLRTNSGNFLGLNKKGSSKSNSFGH